ncbi:MAG TPA: UxaA family hydrolase [Microvirga sp.]|jgi:altronate hydrolase/altronate dehydratase small subunit|nr:UxaA family hydrolase [Microvirga sp.]
MTIVPTSADALVLHADDDVAVLLRPVAAGEAVVASGAAGPATLRIAASLPLGHKIALRPLAAGSTVRKYGEAIGRLTADVAPGEHVHVHNLESLRATGGDAAPPQP